MNPNERVCRLAGARASTHPHPRLLAAAALMLTVAALVLLAGCGPVRLVATANIPQPLVMKIPVAVALFMPQEFAQYVHKEERWGTEWNIEIGKAQFDAMSRLLNAMFERVIVVDSLNAGAQLGEGIAAILEPSVEEYAFVTPRDAGSPFFAVSIKYRVNVYSPDGKLADSWGFTGYGNSPAGGLSNTEPLKNATASAMRDAGAKLAVEFRDQAIVRGLLPESETADGAGGSSAAPSEEEPAAPPTSSEPVQEDGAPAAAPSEPSEEQQPASEQQPSVPAPTTEQEPEEDSDSEGDSNEEEEPTEPEVDALARSIEVRRTPREHLSRFGRGRTQSG